VVVVTVDPRALSDGIVAEPLIEPGVPPSQLLTDAREIAAATPATRKRKRDDALARRLLFVRSERVRRGTRDAPIYGNAALRRWLTGVPALSRLVTEGPFFSER
jgi:hypothetical protein